MTSLGLRRYSALCITWMLATQANCMPLGMQFLEGAGVQSKGAVQITPGTAVGGGYRHAPQWTPAGGVSTGVRVGVGLGAGQELRGELALGLPAAQFTTKLSWKSSFNGHVAVVGNISAMGGALGLGVGGDLGILLSGKSVQALPDQSVSPYFGLRLAISQQLADGPFKVLEKDDILYNLSLGSGLQIALDRNVVLMIEVNYSGAAHHHYATINSFLPHPQWSVTHMISAGVGFRIALGQRQARDRSQDPGLHSEPAAVLTAAHGAMEQELYSLAIERFKIAYALSQDSLLLCNIGEAYRRLFQIREALNYYQLCLEKNPKSQYAPQIKDIVRRLSIFNLE